MDLSFIFSTSVLIFIANPIRTGRPAKAGTIYKVSIHDNGGRKYASTQPFTVDDDGKKHYTHKHWGIVDDDMRFHPNSTYFYAPIEERRKLIFPAEWDLSEFKSLSGTGHRGAAEYEGGDLDRMYGPTWFLDNDARETGLTDDLRKVFDGNMEMFPNFIEINMEKDKQGDRLFAEAKTTENFYLALSVVAGDRMSDKKSTLVFIDEIQAYDHLLTLVKFLMEDGRFTYIASGSLLGVTLKPRWSASNGVFTNICPKIVPNN